MKILLSLVLSLLTIFLSGQNNFHSFTVQDIYGEEVNLEIFKGKKVLVVNTASKCGLTPQYKDLEKLYNEFGGDDFVIIGFPANNFMKQEPGSNEEIAEFCEKNYGVTFPMMAKISVKGKDIHPLYKWLTQKSENGVMNAEVKWNFQKFMIDESGNLVDYLAPRQNPYNDKILRWLEE